MAKLLIDTYGAKVDMYISAESFPDLTSKDDREIELVDLTQDDDDEESEKPLASTSSDKKLICEMPPTNVQDIVGALKDLKTSQSQMEATSKIEQYLAQELALLNVAPSTELVKDEAILPANVQDIVGALQELKAPSQIEAKDRIERYLAEEIALLDVDADTRPVKDNTEATPPGAVACEKPVCLQKAKSESSSLQLTNHQLDQRDLVDLEEQRKRIMEELGMLDIGGSQEQTEAYSPTINRESINQSLSNQLSSIHIPGFAPGDQTLIVKNLNDLMIGDFSQWHLNLASSFRSGVTLQEETHPAEKFEELNIHEYVGHCAPHGKCPASIECPDMRNPSTKPNKNVQHVATSTESQLLHNRSYACVPTAHAR